MNKLLTLGITTLAVAGLTAVGTMSVSALNGQGNGVSNQTTSRHGNGYQSSLESRAKVVNMTANELQKALETKTMSQIAAEKGIEQTAFQLKMTEAAKVRWEARGLSTDEIATRVADQEKRRTANEADGHEFGSGAGNHQGEYGRNR